MNKNWSYKKKAKYLFIGSGLFLIFIYVAVISRTVNLYRANKELSLKLMDAEHAPEKQRILKSKLEKFNTSLSRYTSDSLKNREYLLTMLSNFSHKNNITIKEFPPAVLTSENDFDIETNVVIAEGNYNNLLKLVYEIEQKNQVARPVSVNFQKYFDYKRKTDVLSIKLYLQNIRLRQHENEI